MIVQLKLLEELIEIADIDHRTLRGIFDILGLEVKSIETTEQNIQFKIELLANRGDHFSHLGIARELAAYLGRQLKPLNYGKLPEKNNKLSIKVDLESRLCLRVNLLELELNNFKLPDKIARFLPADEIGKRPPIVDLLNYLQLEIGQPMHAFDIDKLQGCLRFVELEKATEIKALDGKTYVVPAGALVQRDQKEIVGIAGVIGCANSACDHKTTRVLIEAALFDPISIRKTARAMGISTDASFLFERGGDFENQLLALGRVTHEIDIQLGKAAKDTLSNRKLFSYEDKPTEKREVAISPAYIKHQLNLPSIDTADLIKRLTAIGFKISAKETANTEQEIIFEVPSWRLWDISRKQDLLEEYTRVLGLDKVPSKLPPLSYNSPPPNKTLEIQESLENLLVNRGFIEVVTKSFYSSNEVDLLAKLSGDSKGQHIQITNSIESAYSHLKITNALHLAHLAARNRRMGLTSVKAFEFCKLFNRKFKDRDQQFEEDFLSIIFCGRWHTGLWKKPPSREETLGAFAGLLKDIRASLKAKDFKLSQAEYPLLHPGIQAGIDFGGGISGYFGLLHPKINSFVGINEDLFYFEGSLKALVNSPKKEKNLKSSDFPAIWRDLTLRLDKRQFAESAINIMREAAASHLQEIQILDDFTKDGEDFRRVSYRLFFESMERTLENSEVDDQISKILKTLENKANLKLAS
ncbi:MAG TPA: phenylalanine--tRNA ligase subunit beta [Oligoflexia bacterium]|mgnify:CR=1 FL=1|nr:phenylalanine--tRNA ligase subunit beta [Oligoflexia bacterium]HMP27197.1 phenylalanine--tRNA ligase subunit beta [Oligoflexia bacterium]